MKQEDKKPLHAWVRQITQECRLQASELRMQLEIGRGRRR